MNPRLIKFVVELQNTERKNGTDILITKFNNLKPDTKIKKFFNLFKSSVKFDIFADKP